MNQLFISLTLLFTIQLGQSFSFAQTAPVDVLDTLGWSNYQSGTEVLYTSPNGGFVFGNNGYSDKIKVRAVSGENFGRIQKVLFKFGAKSLNSNDPSSQLLVRFYSLDSLGFTSSGAFLVAPGTEVLDSIPLALVDVDTSGGYTSIDVPLSVDYYNSIAVGLDLTQLSIGDTVGLFSTTDGDADNGENSWELQSNSIWISMLNSDFGWDLDAEPAIFVETVHDDSSPNGVEENEQGFSLKLFPNPVNSELICSFSTLRNKRDLYLSITDMAGRELGVYDLMAMDLSSSQFSVSTSNMAEGVYTLTLSSNQNRISKRFEVMH